MRPFLGQKLTVLHAPDLLVAHAKWAEVRFFLFKGSQLAVGDEAGGLLMFLLRLELGLDELATNFTSMHPEVAELCLVLIKVLQGVGLEAGGIPAFDVDACHMLLV
jgi:hypothetical protein